MNSKELAILERSYWAEVNGALIKGPDVLQTKSKIATKLLQDGMLEESEWRGAYVRVKGYRLTHAGRMMYCMSDAAEADHD